MAKPLGLSCCCCSVTQSSPTFCNPMDCSTEGFPVLQHLLELAKLLFIESVMPSNHLILCHPLLLLPSIFPSISIFSNESALHIRWPKYWSFSFSISPSNEYSEHYGGSLKSRNNSTMMQQSHYWAYTLRKLQF